VQVDGWVEGDIQSRNIVIGEGATVHGALQAETVRICGLVKGEIKGDSVVLAKTAKVTGDILHKSLAIEQGAYLEGMCKRLDAAGTPMSMAVPTIAANEAKPLTNGDASKPLAERIAAIS
jgi:cytoskeletal protein CcmA (bactofilin family)